MSSISGALDLGSSALTPNGHFRDVPVDADRYAIDESVATDLNHLIRNGQSLPRRIVRLLPEIMINQ